MAHDPNSTETNSANESKGFTFGLEGDLFVIVVVTVFTATVLFTVFFTLLQWSLIGSLLIVVLPSVPILLWVFRLKQGKPPGYDVDWFEEQVNGKGWSYNGRLQPTSRKTEV